MCELLRVLSSYERNRSIAPQPRARPRLCPAQPVPPLHPVLRPLRPCSSRIRSGGFAHAIRPGPFTAYLPRRVHHRRRRRRARSDAPRRRRRRPTAARRTDEFDTLRLRWRDLTLGTGFEATAEPYATKLAALGTSARTALATMAAGNRLALARPAVERPRHRLRQHERQLRPAQHHGAGLGAARHRIHRRRRADRRRRHGPRPPLHRDLQREHQGLRQLVGLADRQPPTAPGHRRHRLRHPHRRADRPLHRRHRPLRAGQRGRELQPAPPPAPTAPTCAGCSPPAACSAGAPPRSRWPATPCRPSSRTSPRATGCTPTGRSSSTPGSPTRVPTARSRSTGWPGSSRCSPAPPGPSPTPTGRSSSTPWSAATRRSSTTA